MAFASNDPTQNRFISKEECNRILLGRQEFSNETPSLLPPLHKIAVVPTVLITAASDFGQSVACYFIITETPTFMNKVLNFDITSVS